MSAKQALKLAREAFKAKRYDQAIEHARVALDCEPESIPAVLIFARSCDLIGRLDQAEQTYTQALKLKPGLTEALTGLRGIYKRKGSQGVTEFTNVSVKLAQAGSESDDATTPANVLELAKEAIEFAKHKGTPLQHVDAIRLILPDGRLYPLVADLMRYPLPYWLQVASVLERWESSTVNKLIGERRTRIGAVLHDVTIKTKREVFDQTNLEEVYENIINVAFDDAVRRQYEEKQFYRTVARLEISTSESRTAAAEQVLNLARGMVIVKHIFEPAWTICIDWRDGNDLADWDVGVLLEYVGFFPETGLARVIFGFLHSPLAPYELDAEEKKKMIERNKWPDLTNPDIRLGFMTDGLDAAKDSVMAHRLMAQYLYYLRDYTLAIKAGRAGIVLGTKLSTKMGSACLQTMDGLNSLVGMALIRHDAPKNHTAARSILRLILSHPSHQSPSHSEAHAGLGEIAESEGEYAEALAHFQAALEMAPNSVRLQVWTAWCEGMTGRFEAAVAQLKSSLELISDDREDDRKLKVAATFWIGRCLWEMNPTRAARKDRLGAYSWFVATIRRDASFAAAYSSLGVFYRDYANDRRRGRQCFQKAFELSAAETTAAECLARDFADRADWDLVELVANRVIETGHAVPPTGLRLKSLSWPYAALGVVHMNRADFHAAATQFLLALRINPTDYDCFIGLAEAYHNSGRHNSALRAIAGANQVADQETKQANWFGQYIFGNVSRDVGSFEDAIDAYKNVLKARPGEFGVQMALLQTLVEQAYGYLAGGQFARAGGRFATALTVAQNVARKDVFNVWKSIGDACVGLSLVDCGSRPGAMSTMKNLLEEAKTSVPATADGKVQPEADLVGDGTDGSHFANAAIRAYHQAIVVSPDSAPSQAAGWFNIGCAEFRASRLVESSNRARHLRAAIRSFKRAIELEAANSDFWVGLGIATTTINPAVSQHALVRALNINTRSPAAWTALGALYLAHHDRNLADRAFRQAQSIDPDWARAWVGIGLAVPEGSLAGFLHAVEIADQHDGVVRRKFAVARFASLIGGGQSSLTEPLFALRQLAAVATGPNRLDHLRALFLERTGQFRAAADTLGQIVAGLEADFERIESDQVLSKVCGAKADLARVLLAAGNYQEARAMGEDVAALAEGLEESTPSSSPPVGGSIAGRAHLSALLTTGLAAFYSNDMDGALDAFRGALEKAGPEATAEITALLAQVLWAQGGSDEKTIARETVDELLSDPIAQDRAELMVAVMAILDKDGPGVKAALDDISDRPDRSVQPERAGRIEKVRQALRRFQADAQHNPGRQTGGTAIGSTLADIMIAPARPAGWAELAEAVEQGRVAGTSSTDSQFARQVAVLTSTKTDSHDLVETVGHLARAARPEDRLAGVMLAPWEPVGWVGLAEMAGRAQVGL